MIGTKLKKVGYTNNRENIKYIRILIDKEGIEWLQHHLIKILH